MSSARLIVMIANIVVIAFAVLVPIASFLLVIRIADKRQRQRSKHL